MNRELILGAAAIIMVLIGSASCMQGPDCSRDENSSEDMGVGESNSCDEIRCINGATCQLVDGRPQCVCRKGCPKILAPICGTYGNDYNNMCELENHNCNNQQDEQFAYEGRCDGENYPESEVADN